MARILIVDDEDFVRASIAAVLRRAGHLVTLAEDGEDALRKFRPGLYELVITDIVMPRMEGIETLRALRQLQPGIPIIAISGSGGADQGFYLKAASALGADATMHKPFRAAELQQTVEAVLKAASNAILQYPQTNRRDADADAERLARPRDISAGESRFRGSEKRGIEPKRITL